MYTRSPLVAQAFVYGDSLEPSLVAVVVPDPETLLPWAASRGLPQDMKRLTSDPSVARTVLNSMLEEGRTSKLQGFEQVRGAPKSCCCCLFRVDAFSISIMQHDIYSGLQPVHRSGLCRSQL